MRFGHYSDDTMPEGYFPTELADLYKLNSHGYRCPEWSPMPDGKKNVVVLGCSHTFGQGLAENEHWAYHLSKHNTQRLRYWNLGQPGASGDRIVRILYACERTIDPKIVIVCWPDYSRRERLEKYSINLAGSDSKLKHENEETDLQNFLKNVFFVEKYAEYNNAKTFHCFAQTSYGEHIPELQTLKVETLANCWPYWDRISPMPETHTASKARDGDHYGIEHHNRFAKLFLDKFRNKLK